MSDQLTKKWETPQTLQVPESVCYDPSANVLYVANINGKPADKDGNGFISKVGMDGTILQLSWVTGLNGPKGMGVYLGKLYVTDIDRVAEIDIATGKILRFYDFPEAKFLNDIAIDDQGAVYVSDSGGTRVYKIFLGVAEVWLDDPILVSPNGLCVSGQYLMIGCDKILQADLTTRKLTEWLAGTGSIDGLEPTGDGRYLFSDWQGSVYLVGLDKKKEKILDTSPVKINAADIDYIPMMKMLLVPTFFDNRVMAYELK